MFTATAFSLTVIGALLVALLVMALPSFLKHAHDVSDMHVWDKKDLPLSIDIDPDLVDVAPELIDALEEAILYWNSLTGLSLFTMDSKGTAPIQIKPRNGATSMMKYDLSYEEAQHSMCSLVMKCTPPTMFVEASALKDIDHHSLSRILEHELGHVLGLHHDEFVGSVMSSKLADCDLMLTPRQMELIKALYA